MRSRSAVGRGWGSGRWGGRWRLFRAEVRRRPGRCGPFRRRRLWRLAGSSEFERGEREEGHDQASDPEAGDDFRFLPAEGFEVMMQRGHFEDALAAELEAADLEDHREAFDHVDAADEEKKNFLFEKNRDDAEASAESERADVSHEDFGGMGVEPKKAERGSGHRGAEDGEFGGAGGAGKFEV